MPLWQRVARALSIDGSARQENVGEHRVIVVVGAGRSGTSALTRGIGALGVELGNNLRRPSGKNPRGFYEDRDLTRVNHGLRDVFGCRRSAAGVAPIAAPRFDAPAVDSLADEAAALIRRRFGACPLWGFKAGGVLNFLPFWEDVFSRAGMRPSYVLAVRNPVSVARSRARLDRQRGTQQNCDLEFLTRVVPYFRRAAHHPVSVVDYDRLMADAKGELLRVADELDIPVTSATARALETYAEGFLTARLQHARSGEQDLDTHPTLSPLARDTYRVLHGTAGAGGPGLADPAFWREWARCEAAYAAMVPLLHHIDDLDTQARRSVTGVMRSARNLVRRGVRSAVPTYAERGHA
jgi:hypothetical protein